MSDSESTASSDNENTSDKSKTWSFIAESTTQLHVDDVEMFLLNKARMETRRVSKTLLTRMFGSEDRPLSDVTTLDIIKAWLDPTLLAVARKQVNSNLDANAFISYSELLEFIEVELWLSFYSASPSNFYDRANKSLYPPVKSVMRSKRYFAILNAFGTQREELEASSSHWKAPFEHDRHLARAMDTLRHVCSEIGFINEVSIASLDDDLLRLRSSSVDDLGLTRIRNPKKGFGPVQHGIVSLVTGLFLGGHIASKGESVVDVVKILQRSLCGATTDSQIRLPGVMFALDRGYQSKEVNRQIIECGATIIGTHKKNASFPFTFGKPPSKSQQLVNEIGPKYARWAVSNSRLRAGTTVTAPSMYALAYRSGLGNVVLCNTSVESVGPGSWSYIVECRSDLKSTASIGDPFGVFEDKVTMLTDSQRSPDWFLMRQFRITGLVAIKILRALAKHSGSVDDQVGTSSAVYAELAGRSAVQLVLKLLKISRKVSSDQLRPATSEREQQCTRTDLERLKCSDLKQLCRDRGLAGYGSKAAMIDRILEENVSVSAGVQRAAIKSPVSVLLEAWFLQPRSSSEMKVGSKNEDNISSRLPVWFREQTQYDLKHTKSYGLLCRPDMKYLAFSPGGVGMFSSPETQDFFAILEYKTRTTPVTIAKEAAIATKYDKFVTITLNSAEDGDDFKTIVPDQSHRSQLLHNTIGASLTNGMLVYASPTSIIRVVHVILSDDVIDAYLLAISGVKDLCLDWIYTSNAPVPSLSTDELGFCGDLEILKQHLSLWRELCKIVDARGKPLPAAKHIIPTLIATWNRVKGGIDVYSRFLKNVRARHQHLPPLAAIWIRILMTIVYNAFQSTQLLQTYSFLMFDERCDSYSALQQFKSDNLKLVDFFRDAALAMPDLITRQEEPNPNADIEPSILSNAVTTMAISTAYNKLDRFNNDPEFRRLRLSKRHCHHAERFDAGKQLCCILCCQLNHDSENLPHTRKGYKTRFYCSICDVALCQTPRWSDNQSCFERFHALTKVPKACQPSTEQMQQPKHIRAPPPSRKRSQ